MVFRPEWIQLNHLACQFLGVIEESFSEDWICNVRGSSTYILIMKPISMADIYVCLLQYLGNFPKQAKIVNQTERVQRYKRLFAWKIPIFRVVFYMKCHFSELIVKSKASQFILVYPSFIPLHTINLIKVQKNVLRWKPKDYAIMLQVIFPYFLPSKDRRKFSL